MREIPNPESQTQEVLYQLINRLQIDRKSMMLSCDVYNLPARIFDLRGKGLNIHSETNEHINKYGREIETTTYSLKNKKEASLIYLELKKNQSRKR